MLNVLFFGTPSIAVPFLDWLIEHTRVVGVVSRPDEPAGRGYEIKEPPTKIRAREKNIPVFQPTGPWTQPLPAADVGLVVAYGRILPPAIYSAPRYGSINIHFSLLPAYRGAAPMQWALINGEKETGVSAFWLEQEMDSGPVFHSQAVAIDPHDKVPELRQKCVRAGLDVLVRVMSDLEKGQLITSPQVGTPSWAPQLTKDMGRIVWSAPAQKIVNLIRGVSEWPGAYALIPGGKRLKVMDAEFEEKPVSGNPGCVVDVVSDRGILVQTGQGALLLKQVQPEGKKPMPATAYWQGARLKRGDFFE